MNSAPASVVIPAMPMTSPCVPHPIATRAPRAGRGCERGFTLIEIVVAFAILSLGLGITMQIASGAMRNTRVAAERTEAALYAKSLLDTVGVGERLEEGSESGEFGERYRWTLEVSPFEVETGTSLQPGSEPVQLYRIELLVTWGKPPREQEAKFVTMRALTPDPGGIR